MADTRLTKKDKMKAYRLTDYMLPSIILNNEEIMRNIYEDGAVFQTPDVIKECWVGVNNEDDRIIGCYRLHQLGHVLWQAHAYILPSFRKEYSLKASRTVLKWASYNINKINKVLVLIPEIHTNVIEHAKKVGFKKDGVLGKSFLKNGKIIDQEIWSISRKQIEEL